MNIICFYEPLFAGSKLTDLSKDCRRLIELWKKSWRNYGWNPIVLSLNDAQKHPRYKEIDLKNYSSNLYKYSINEANYLEMCYSRWFAYGVEDGVWSDYDVINYGLRPENITDLVQQKDPVFFDEIGSCGFSTYKGHDLIIDGLIKAYQDDYIVDNILLLQRQHHETIDISDMHINRRENTPISFLNNICVSNFHDNKWRQSQLVHYHNGLWNNFLNHQSKTRSDFIIKERPPTHE